MSDDVRLYLPRPELWQIKVKPSYDREYCHAKFPGEDHYHLLMGGEIHLSDGERTYCLACALRDGIITTDRLYWQKQKREGKERDL